MPPKPKFTREELLLAALAIVSEKGADALTARELAKRLGCSTRPIFTLFEDMDELKSEVRTLAATKVEKICSHAMLETGDFCQAVIEAVRFAKREPNIYELVFMTGNNHEKNFVELLRDNEVTLQDYLRFIQDVYGLNDRDAEMLFEHMWVHCLGMGVLCATQRYLFSEDELIRLAEIDMQGMLAYFRQVARVQERQVSERDADHC